MARLSVLHLIQILLFFSAVNKLSTAKFPGWEARHGIEWFAFLQAKVKSITDGDS
jgi:hypothetical protein